MTAGALALACGVAAVPVRASDVGNAAAADVSLKVGSKTYFLELIPDQAVVTFTGSKAGSANVLGEYGTLATGEGGVSLIQAAAGSAVAQDAKAARLSLADYLVGQENVAFAGPVFKIADRVVGVSNQVIVKFNSGTSSSARAEVLAKYGLSGDTTSNIVVAKLNTSDGAETLKVVASLGREASVELADVDWLTQYESTNVTPLFGGTSSAAPVVSGVAGLIRWIDPSLSADEVGEIIRTTAVAHNAQDPLVGQIGTGIVNAANAVRETIMRRDGDVTEPTPAQIAAMDAMLRAGDPLYAYQWHLQVFKDDPVLHPEDTAGGVPIRSIDHTPDAVNTADIDLSKAFAIMQANGFWPIADGGGGGGGGNSKGEGAPGALPRLAVIDTGTAYNHDDLNVVAGYDAATDDTVFNGSAAIQGQPRSAETHGTSVAGVMAGRMGNGIAGLGAAPGFPTVAVRLISAPDQRLSQESSVLRAFQFAVDQDAEVINNSWGPAFGADPCTPSSVTYPLLPGEQLALDTATGANVLVVFSAGNDRANMDADELNGSDQVLTVASTNNLARSSSYTSYGSSVDVSAPSNDFQQCPTDPTIWTGGDMGIVTTTMDFMGLGGNNPRFDPVDPVAYGGVNDASIADWTGLLRDRYFRLTSRTITGTTYNETFVNTAPHGIVFGAEAGHLEILPNTLLMDDLGRLTGSVTLRVRSATGVVTQQFTVPLTLGLVRFMRTGTVDQIESGSTLLLLAGNSRASGQFISFMVQGTERYLARNGAYQFRGRGDSMTLTGGSASEQIPTFRVRSMASIQGVGSQRTEGAISRIGFATSQTGGTIRTGPTFNHSSMYLTSQASSVGGRVVRGGAAIDYSSERSSQAGSATTGGRGLAIMSYSTPGTFGRGQAIMSNGRWMGMSMGYHTADTAQASVDLANLTYFPSQIMVFSPNSLVMARSTDRPTPVLPGGEAPGAEINVFRLSGGGTATILLDNTGSVDFGASTLNQQPVNSVQFRVVNGGNINLTLGTPTVPSGFQVTESLATSIAPGGSDTFTIALLTNTEGTFTGQVQITTNDSDENPFNFAVTGFVGSSARASVLDGQLAIADNTGTVNMGVTTRGSTLTKRLTVRNTGTSTLQTSALTVAAPFSITEPLNASIPAGGEDTFDVSISTSAAGTYLATLSFGTNVQAQNPYNFQVGARVD